MKHLLTLLLLLCAIYAQSQTKTIIVKYDNGTIAALEIPDNTRLKLVGDNLTLTTSSATLELPRHNISRYFVADAVYMRDSIADNTPRLVLNTDYVQIDDPGRARYATIMDGNFQGLQSVKPHEPLVFLFSEFKSGTYVLPLSNKKVRLKI